jgi:hypothetical protein
MSNPTPLILQNATTDTLDIFFYDIICIQNKKAAQQTKSDAPQCRRSFFRGAERSLPGSRLELHPSQVNKPISKPTTTAIQGVEILALDAPFPQQSLLVQAHVHAPSQSQISSP